MPHTWRAFDCLQFRESLFRYNSYRLLKRKRSADRHHPHIPNAQ
jgi:hypothetical protein